MADKPNKEYISDEERERNAMFDGESNIAGVTTVTISNDSFADASPDTTGVAYDLMMRERTLTRGGEIVKEQVLAPHELPQILKALGGAVIALISSQKDPGKRLQLASGFGGEVLRQVVTPSDFMSAVKGIREKRESCDDDTCNDCEFKEPCGPLPEDSGHSTENLTDKQKAALDMVLKSPGFKVPEC